MASDNVKQLNIWKTAHEWLARVSAAYKSKGNSSASMTQLASQAILAIPMPNGNNPQPETLDIETPDANVSVDQSEEPK